MDDLIYINMKNGTNELITDLRICNNIGLECIQVDDPVAVIAATDPPYDSWVLFNNNNALITDDCQLGIEGVDEAQIAVYPNPVSSILYLKTEQNVSIKFITIYDALGRRVYKQRGNIEQVEMNSLPSGLYFLKIQTNQGAVVKKIIKD